MESINFRNKVNQYQKSRHGLFKLIDLPENQQTQLLFVPWLVTSFSKYLLCLMCLEESSALQREKNAENKG